MGRRKIRTNESYYVSAWITDRERMMLETLQEYFGTGDIKLSKNSVIRIALAELYKAKVIDSEAITA